MPAISRDRPCCWYRDKFLLLFKILRKVSFSAFGTSSMVRGMARSGFSLGLFSNGARLKVSAITLRVEAFGALFAVCGSFKNRVRVVSEKPDFLAKLEADSPVLVNTIFSQTAFLSLSSIEES